MNRNIAEFAKTSLKEIQISSKASNITCHLGNQISEQFWLFFAEGNFLLKEQVNGPLIHPKQNERLTTVETARKPGFSFVVEYNPDPRSDGNFNEEILFGQPFVIREKIACSFKVTIACPRTDEIVAVVFLNFRNKPSESRIAKTRDDLWSKFAVLAPVLIELSTEPLVDRKVAMTFRGTLVKIIREFGENYYTSTETWRENFLAGVVTLMRNLIDDATSERSGVANKAKQHRKTVVCQIYSLERNGKLEVLAGDDNPRDENSRDGVVEFVARTGDIFLISNIPEYTEQWAGRKKRHYDLIPEYQIGPTEIDPESGETMPGTELAIPIVLGDKVLGVLNLESLDRYAYDPKIVALAYYFSTVLALVLKEYLTWSDSHTVSAFSEKLLKYYHAEDVLKELKDTVVKLKYRATVWNVPEERAVEGYETTRRGGEQIRTDTGNPGFTHWISKNLRAVRLIDCQIGSDGRVTCEKQVTSKPITTRDFEFIRVEDAENVSELPDTENPAIREHIEKYAGVLCDVGFPICKDNICYGVLWVKMNRYSSTILQDEYWTLSHICNLAGAAIARIANLSGDKITSDPEYLARKQMLTFHFGETRANTILASKQSLNTILQAKWVEDLIVMNIDIRGSSNLMRRAAENVEAVKLARFIHEYHNYVSDYVTSELSRGILDKTIGDGVMAIFNGYRDDAMKIDGDINGSLESIQERAIECVFSIFERFETEWEEFRKELSFGTTKDIVLGCGLVHDRARNLLGSLDSKGSVGHFDYSVNGPASNASGKLVDMARRTTVNKFLTEMIILEETHDRKFSIETLVDRKEIGDLKDLYKRIHPSKRSSILLCSVSFGKVIANRDGWNGVQISMNRHDDKDLNLFSDSIIWAYRED